VTVDDLIDHLSECGLVINEGDELGDVKFKEYSQNFGQNFYRLVGVKAHELFRK